MFTAQLKKKQMPFIKILLTTILKQSTQYSPVCATKYPVSDILLALCAGWRCVALVDFVPDACAKGLIAVSGQQSSWPGQQAKVVKESVPLFNAILKEETVTQSVIA